MDTLTAMPESFAAGTTVKYTRTLSDYAANDGWTLTLQLAGVNVLTATAAPDGADHAVTLAAADTKNLTAGSYLWAEVVTNGTDTYRVAQGRVTVEPNLGVALAGEHQSANERMLKAITAVIESRLGTGGAVPKDVEAYSIDGITVTKIPLEQLMRYRTQYATAVAREKRGGGLGRNYRMAFTGARNES